MYGLKQGSLVNFKGMKIGFVKNVNMQLNTIVILVQINSSHFLIPKNSIIETNQVGLFNDVVIDICPLEQVSDSNFKSMNPFSKDCIKSPFLCANFYIRGYRGLNYDDLVRATTRISQRFDDPRFFKLFYIFLRNGINLSEELLFFINHLSFAIYLFVEWFQLLL